MRNLNLETLLPDKRKQNCTYGVDYLDQVGYFQETFTKDKSQGSIQINFSLAFYFDIDEALT